MKKQLKTLIFCLVAVAVLAAAYFIVSALLPDSETDDDKLYIVKGSADTMFAVKVEFPESQGGYRYIIGKIPQVDESILYIYQDNGVYDGYEYSQSLMEDAFTRFMELEATELVYEETDNLAEFGLDDDSAVRVTITPFDVLAAENEALQPITLLIGSYNSVSNAYYAKRADAPEIYMITELNANTYLNGPNRYRSLDILPDFGTYYDNLKTVTLNARNGESIVLERHETFESEEEGVLIYTTFRMVEPYRAYVSDTVAGESFLDLISSLMVMQVVENNPEDLSVYGLDDENSFTVEFVTNAGEKTTMRFGSVSSNIFVMIEGIDSVYAAYGDISFGDLTAMDLRSSLVWLHNIKDVAKVEMSLPNGDYVLDVDDTVNADDGSGTFVAALNGTALSEDNGRRLYTSIISIQYDNILAGEAIESEPSYTFKITYRSGFTETLRFYKATSRQYIVCLGEDTQPEETNFCANITYLRKVVENIDTILSGGTISRY